MDYGLEPRTEPGKQFVELAEKHAAEAAPRAAEHDRDGTFPTEAIDAMKESGFLKATLPASFGGIGLTSMRDLAIGISRLARADAGLAIAVNMHFTSSWVGTRLHRGAVEVGDEEQAATMATFMTLIGGGSILMANATEAGTDLSHPLTEIRQVDEGWSITGTKIFSTLSPVADMFLVTARERRDDGDIGGFSIVFRGMPGQTINDDWDALGMRSSGSGSIRYEDCVIPETLRLPGRAWGEDDDTALVVGSAGNLGLVASMMGIAEAAADHAIQLATTRKKGPDGRLIGERVGVQHAVAEMRASLATSRGVVDRAGTLLDEWLADRPVADVDYDRLHSLNAEFQTAKLVSNRAAIETVDKALQISGGAGYMTSSPLSRWYRDVRAGPFMQIYSPNEAYQYIGQVTLGLPPNVDV